MDPVIEKKLRAAGRFVERLLATPAKAHIAKVILHGSVAQGTARPESDVDLVIFQIGGDDTVADLCAQVGFETLMETTESVEPLIFPWNDYRYPPSYFIYHALWRGQEIYSMEKEQLKRQEIEDLHRLAIHYLQGAKSSLAAGHSRVATDIAYNAAELAAKGLLFLRLDDLPSTHRGVVNKFGELYIKSGRLPETLGRSLNKGLQYRNLARYAYRAEIGADEAEEVIRLAENLLAALEAEQQAGGANEQQR